MGFPATPAKVRENVFYFQKEKKKAFILEDSASTQPRTDLQKLGLPPYLCLQGFKQTTGGPSRPQPGAAGGHRLPARSAPILPKKRSSFAVPSADARRTSSCFESVRVFSREQCYRLFFRVLIRECPNVNVFAASSNDRIFAETTRSGHASD